LSQAGTLSFADVDPSEQPVFVIDDGPSIHWWRGQLVVSGADQSEIAPLRRIAGALHGRVQGDDGEFYD
jgi:hypothetical protein